LKTDRYVKGMFKRLDNIIFGSSPFNSRWDIGKTQQELDDIETQQYGEPHRFGDYRHVRCKKTKPAVGITCEDVYDSITQEELDWSLRHGKRKNYYGIKRKTNTLTYQSRCYIRQ
jgi:hypothetical protein